MAPTRSTHPQHQQRSPERRHHADLPADPRAVSEARRLVRDAIRFWNLSVDEDIALLITSELVTNAITHGSETASAMIALTTTGELDCLRVEVFDTSFATPVIKNDPLSADEHGRGMLLVDSLATTWGWDLTAAGKVVYFTLDS
jgi:anti-sigma regulatory factor (Ser/Thr protein kinase)